MSDEARKIYELLAVVPLGDLPDAVTRYTGLSDLDCLALAELTVHSFTSIRRTFPTPQVAAERLRRILGDAPFTRSQALR
jgi:hypothetical protein